MTIAAEWTNKLWSIHMVKLLVTTKISGYFLLEVASAWGNGMNYMP